MKKRLISILLCGVLVLSMAACGSKEGTKKEEAKTEETTKGNSGEATDKKYGLDMDSIVVAISSGYEPFCFDKDNELLHTATFRGHQGRVLRPDRAILSGQS